jgi:steroid delta-isomerase-like uncharacterized protein
MRSKRLLLTVALGVALFAPAGAHGEDNKALVRRWYEEVWNKGNVAAVDDFLAPTYVGHTVGAPDVKGSDDVKQRVVALATAFPDRRLTVEDIIAEGDKAAVRYTLRGTHRGEFMGIAPTNKELRWTGMAIFHIRDGKFQEIWLMTDIGRQLGMGSAQGQRKP